MKQVIFCIFAKKVFSLKENIIKFREKLSENGFEVIDVTFTGKKNETDLAISIIY